MFSYLRLISLAGLVLVVAVAGWAGISYRNHAIDRTIEVSEQNKQHLAVGYTQAVWRYYRDVVIPLSMENPEELRTNTSVAQFARATMEYFKAMPLLRVNIYNGAGMLLMKVDGTAAGGLAATPISPDKEFVVQETRSGKAVTNIIGDTTLNNGTQADLSQTMVPIFDGEGKLDGVIEIIEPLQSPDPIGTMGHYALGGLILIFLGLIAVANVYSRKAEIIITKQHETNLELAAAAEAAQAENIEKSKFLANVSHELRTPLNAIIGFSDIIKNEVVSQLENKKYHDYINDIHTSGVHLLSLINDILDYSKAEAGKLELEVSEVNATKLIQNCMRLVSSRAEEAEVRLEETLPKEAIVMLTDSKKLKQVFLNLLSNAVKFTEPDGEIRISAWASASDDSYSFEVRDTGIGIAPKDISRAMSPFGQVDNELSRKYEGTGLGLPLTKKFVELMGGKFTIESEVGKGTTITFSLPRQIEERDGIIIKYIG